MFFDGLDCEGIVDSILASPLESSLEFPGAVGCVPPCSSKEPWGRKEGVLNHSFWHLL